ncbi:hypothetical protein M075_1455 [Bacteroides fragilis str. 20793-3]|nr:hypothetical protein M075_1455 [Bacteroides fragilis str. 20793-3]
MSYEEKLEMAGAINYKYFNRISINPMLSRNIEIINSNHLISSDFKRRCISFISCS